MTAPQCRTCKHWRPLDDMSLQYGPLRTPTDPWDTWEARSLERNAGYGNCVGVEFYADVERDEGKPLAVVVDGSGYVGKLVTQPEFGCVLHESEEGP